MTTPLEKLRNEVYNNDQVAKIEAKTSVKLISEAGNKMVYEGNYPVEPFREGARGTYGGDFIAQGLNVAWESIDRPDFQPHSLHSYFVKAGSKDSVLRWEVIKVSDSRNFSNRIVFAYQAHTDQLAFTLQCSFTRDNHLDKRDIDHQKLVESGADIRSVPFQFKRNPNPKFFKYKDNIEDLVYFEHTNGNIAHAIPEEIFSKTHNFNMNKVGDEELGFYVKFLDDYNLGKDYIRQSFLGLAFASDSLWLATLVKALGLPITGKDVQFFRVSLDHTLYFHDLNFDSSSWLFVDYRFLSMGNNRILAVVNFYTLEGKAIATAVQEAYGFLPGELVERSRKLHEKYNGEGSIQQVNVAKL
ncbi:hypothetical protein CANMA_002031 [Candida margitis]|uniref:uncharacterized protein n=1 Tax=Candida margitis TaxID=1775924 RepID=UPI00222784B4|nr:uncharacterized protein CANMA_002031 [Candida margitis]KAI5968857.1 hypothetical protein CANMA_002031 [Candida margitis]